MNMHPDHVHLVVAQRVGGYDKHAALHRSAAVTAWKARCRAARELRRTQLQHLVRGLLSRFVSSFARRRMT